MLRAIGQPVRLRILLAIGRREACVCHLEALLGLRQAHISQQLMALRKAGILSARREGRFIYYRLNDPRLLDLIQMAGRLAKIPETELKALVQADQIPHCCCPKCVATLVPRVEGADTMTV